MKFRVPRFSGALRVPLLFLPFIFTGFVCRNDTLNPRLEKRPGPPVIDSLRLYTLDDIQPCIQMFFSDTNQLEVSFNAYRANSGGVLSPVEGGQGIPKTYRLSADSLQQLWFKDIALFQNLVLQNDFETFYYSLKAVSRADSLSDPSGVDSFRLLKPALIDTISFVNGYPDVFYQLGGQMGTTWHIEITHGDTLVLARSAEKTRFGFVQGDDAFVSLPLDTLKAMALREPGFDGTYGVRIFSSVGSARGIAVSHFKVLP